MPNCLLLPHGVYSLVITVLVTTGWLAALFEDGCNYAKLSGDLVVEELGLSPDIPYVEVGLQAYRVPTLDAENDNYDPEFFGQCVAYPDSVTPDLPWNFAKGFSFLALVLGGGATFYLWISTCCRFSRGSWRWAGYEVAAACLFQMLSFVYFLTDICQTNKCELFYGSKGDIVSSLMWLLAAILIFGHYPTPRELVEADGLVVNSNGSRSSSRRRGGGGSRESDASGELVMTEITRRPSQEDEKPQQDEEMAAGENSEEPRKPNLDDVELT